MMHRRHSEGLTIVELLIGLAIASTLAVVVSTLAIRVCDLNRENQISMLNQQDVAFALHHFTDDVRSSVQVHAPTQDSFVLEQTDDRYVWYRIDKQDQVLLRGLTSSRKTAPESWTPVINEAEFKVLDGRFDYFTREGHAPDPERPVEIRRIDLAGLNVLAIVTQQTRRIPTISASMRLVARLEPSPSPSPSPGASPPAGGFAPPAQAVDLSHAKNPKFAFSLHNATGEKLTLKRLDFVWSPEDHLLKSGNAKVVANGEEIKDKTLPFDFDRPPTISRNGDLDLDFQLHLEGFLSRAEEMVLTMETVNAKGHVQTHVVRVPIRY